MLILIVFIAIFGAMIWSSFLTWVSTSVLIVMDFVCVSNVSYYQTESCVSSGQQASSAHSKELFASYSSIMLLPLYFSSLLHHAILTMIFTVPTGKRICKQEIYEI